MKITVISRWYNEAFLAPFFCRHYSWANEILILLDRAMTDTSEAQVYQFPNTKVEYCGMPDGLLHDDYLVELINKRLRKIDADWVISVDADEFVFPQNMADARETLSGADGNLIFASLWQIYRHADDKDLDPKLPAIFQRRHGDPNRTEGINALYNKPIIVKPETEIEWLPGQHYYKENPKIQISTTRFDGAHWELVDLGLAIKRRILGRRNRFSQKNKSMRWGWRWFDITEEELREQYRAHLNCPRLF